MDDNAYLLQLYLISGFVATVIIVFTYLYFSRLIHIWKIEKHNLMLTNKNLLLEKRSMEAAFNQSLMTMNEYIHELERKWIRDYLQEGLFFSIDAMREKLKEVQQSLPEGSPAAHLVQHTNEMILQQARFVTSISDHLMPERLKTLGLVKALAEVFEGISPEGYRISISGNNVEKRYPPQLELALYRVTSALVMNSIQRQDPNDIRLNFFSEKDRLQIDYQDNGKNLNAIALAHAPAENKDRAVQRIEILIRMVKGQITYDTNYLDGLKLTIKIDLSKISLGPIPAGGTNLSPSEVEALIDQEMAGQAKPSPLTT